MGREEFGVFEVLGERVDAAVENNLPSILAVLDAAVVRILNRLRFYLVLQRVHSICECERIAMDSMSVR